MDFSEMPSLSGTLSPSFGTSIVPVTTCGSSAYAFAGTSTGFDVVTVVATVVVVVVVRRSATVGGRSSAGSAATWIGAVSGSTAPVLTAAMFAHRTRSAARRRYRRIALSYPGTPSA